MRLMFVVILCLKIKSAYLSFLSSVETDAIRYTGLEICNGVILCFNCRGLWRRGQLKSLHEYKMGSIKFIVSH